MAAPHLLYFPMGAGVSRRPLCYRYIVATLSPHCRHVAATLPLRCRYIAVAGVSRITSPSQLPLQLPLRCRIRRLKKTADVMVGHKSMRPFDRSWEYEKDLFTWDDQKMAKAPQHVMAV